MFPLPEKAARKDWDKQQWGSKQEKFKDCDSGFQWDMGVNTELKWGLRYIEQTDFTVSEEECLPHDDKGRRDDMTSYFHG